MVRGVSGKTGLGGMLAGIDVAGMVPRSPPAAKRRRSQSAGTAAVAALRTERRDIDIASPRLDAKLSKHAAAQLALP
jgi:hypothetical protein